MKKQSAVQTPPSWWHCRYKSSSWSHVLASMEGMERGLVIIVGRCRKFAPSPKTNFTIPLTKNAQVMLFILERQVMAAAMSGRRCCSHLSCPLLWPSSERDRERLQRGLSLWMFSVCLFIHGHLLKVCVVYSFLIFSAWSKPSRGLMRPPWFIQSL